MNPSVDQIRAFCSLLNTSRSEFLVMVFGMFGLGWLIGETIIVILFIVGHCLFGYSDDELPTWLKFPGAIMGVWMAIDIGAFAIREEMSRQKKQDESACS